MSSTFAPRIRGHERVRAMLGRVIAHDQLHPSLIISGPTGIGKARLAHELALALNCEAEVEQRPCHGCKACLKGDRGTHPDLITVAPSEGRRSVTIGQVREMIAELGLKPHEGRRRVVVLEEADGLREDAQNALLKTLEEPPGRSVTVLLASRPNQLIATIHSRCQHLRLTALTEAEVTEVLVDAGTARAEAAERARFAGGSPGEALSEEGRERAEDALRVFEALARGDAARDPMGIAKELQDSISGGSAADQRRRLEELGGWLMRGLRDVLALKVAGAGAAPLAPFLSEAGAQLAPRVTLAGLRRAIDGVEAAQQGMRRNLHTQLSIEGLILDLVAAFA